MLPEIANASSIINTTYYTPFCTASCPAGDTKCLTKCNVPAECQFRCEDALTRNKTEPAPLLPDLKLIPSIENYFNADGTVKEAEYVAAVDAYMASIGGPLRRDYSTIDAYQQGVKSFVISAQQPFVDWLDTKSGFKNTPEYLQAKQRCDAAKQSNTCTMLEIYEQAKIDCKEISCVVPSGRTAYCDGKETEAQCNSVPAGCFAYCKGKPDEARCQQVCEGLKQGGSDCGMQCNAYVSQNDNCSTYWVPKVKIRADLFWVGDAETCSGGNIYSKILSVDWSVKDYDSVKWGHTDADVDKAEFYAGVMNTENPSASICVWSAGTGWRAADEAPTGAVTAGAVTALMTMSLMGGPLAPFIAVGTGIAVAAGGPVALDGAFGVRTPWSVISNNKVVTSTPHQQYKFGATSMMAEYWTVKAKDSSQAYSNDTNNNGLKVCYKVPLAPGPEPCCKRLTAPIATAEVRDLALDARPKPLPDAYSTFFNPSIRVLFRIKPSEFADVRWEYPGAGAPNYQPFPPTGRPAANGGVRGLTDPSGGGARNFRMYMDEDQTNNCVEEIDGNDLRIRDVGCKPRVMDMSLGWTVFPMVEGTGIDSAYNSPKIKFKLNGQSIVLTAGDSPDRCKTMFGHKFCAYKTTHPAMNYDKSLPYICVANYFAPLNGEVQKIVGTTPLPPGAASPVLPDGLCVVAPPRPCEEIMSPEGYLDKHGNALWEATELESAAIKEDVTGICATGFRVPNPTGAYPEPLPARQCVRLKDASGKYKGEFSQWANATATCSERITCEEDNQAALAGTPDGQYATYWAAGAVAATDPNSGEDNPTGTSAASPSPNAPNQGRICLDANYTPQRDGSGNIIKPTRVCREFTIPSPLSPSGQTRVGAWAAFNTIQNPCVPRGCQAFTYENANFALAKAGTVGAGQCKAGYGTVSGNTPKMRCNSDGVADGDGVWDKSSLTESCLAQCPTVAESLGAGYVITKTGNPDEKVTAKCATGFATPDKTDNNTFEATCSKNPATPGVWENVTGKCVPASCPAEIDPKSGTSVPASDDGTVINVCASDSENPAARTATCEAGVWKYQGDEQCFCKANTYNTQCTLEGTASPCDWRVLFQRTMGGINAPGGDPDDNNYDGWVSPWSCISNSDMKQFERTCNKNGSWGDFKTKCAD
jgi:hypothetical protein